MNTIKIAKSSLRKEMKAKIKLLTQNEKIRQSQIVTEKLLALPQYKKSQRLSIFLSMNDEIRTEDILKHALQDNKACFIPRYDSLTTKMDMVRLHSWNEYESLPVTSWNIKQPPLEESREEALGTGGLDLILIPGMAFTQKGDRMGRGKGYYDTYLSMCTNQQSTPPITIALAFNEQIVVELPVEKTDVPIDIILRAE